MTTRTRAVPPKIALINSSSNVSDDEGHRCAEALNVQVDRDFGPVWGLNCSLVYVPQGKKPPKASWWLSMIDNPDIAGALGYHDLTDEGYPIGKIFTRLQTDGDPWTITASHELLEMLADPYIYLAAGPDRSGKWLAYEVCDACEAQSYEIDGIKVSDFVYPAWFGDGPGPDYNHLGGIKQPFQLLAGGYISYWSPNGGWQEAFADKADPETRLKSRPNVGARRERRRVGEDRWLMSTPR